MASSISKSAFAGGITTMHIGSRHVVFNVHSSLLSEQSSYFEDVLSKQHHENSPPIELLNENPNIFHLLANWLYHRRIINTSSPRLEPDWQDLIHLWLLADRVQMRALQRDVIWCFRQKTEHNSSKAVCPLDMIDYAYKRTSANSPLRRAISEVWVDNARHVKELSRLVNKLPTGFLEDVCFAFVKKAQRAERYDDEVESLSMAEDANEPVTNQNGQHQEKEITPPPPIQSPTEVELNQTQYELPVETPAPVAPVAPVVASFEQSNDHLFEPDTTTAATSFQGEEEEEDPTPIPPDTPPDDNRSTIDPSTQSVSSRSSKKKKKNKGKNKYNNNETLHNIEEPDSFAQQANGSPDRYVNGFNDNGPQYVHANQQQQQPYFDDYEAPTPHQWAPPPQSLNDFGSSRNSQNGSGDYSFKKKNKKENKQQQQYHIPADQRGHLPTGQRADRDRQNDFRQKDSRQNDSRQNDFRQNDFRQNDSRQNDSRQNNSRQKDFGQKDSYSPAQSPAPSFSHSRRNTNGSQYQYQQPQPQQPMPNGPKNRNRDNRGRDNTPRDSRDSRDSVSYQNDRRKQPTGSRFDPARQSGPQPMQNGRSDQRPRRR